MLHTIRLSHVVFRRQYCPLRDIPVLKGVKFQDPAAEMRDAKMAELAASLELERSKLIEMREATELASMENDKSVTDAVAKLQEQLASAASGGDMAMEMERIRQEAAARMDEQSAGQDIERAKILDEMQKVQEALTAERERNIQMMQVGSLA
jgi:uncharacterized glyoxalase superfamily metalloenzyme YdcJ